MTQEEIDDLTLKVYCARVDADSGKGASERMIAKDADGGLKQRARSAFYRSTVVETLVQLGLYKRPVPNPKRAKGETA